MGLVSASKTRKYNAIWRIPFPVMPFLSETLGTKKRVEQIHPEG
jgi:hypothetical protein